MRYRQLYYSQKQKFRLLFEIFHQHFPCSRGQKRWSCQHISQHNNSFPDIALPQEITDTSGGWEALTSCIPALSLFPLSLHLLTDSLLTHSYFLSVSLLHQLPGEPALLRGHPSEFLYIGPIAVNCSKKKYYVQPHQRDSDHTNKQGVAELRSLETVAVVDILLWLLFKKNSKTFKKKMPYHFWTSL